MAARAPNLVGVAGRRNPSSSIRVSRCVHCALLAGAALAAAAVLPGCGNSPYPAGETARPVIYRSLADDPRTLDPSVAYTVTEAQLIDVVYPAYYRYHYLQRDPFVLELALGAEEPRRERASVTETVDGRPVRREGERWTFRLRPGVYFQDDPCFPGGKGREVTAADLAYSFRRMADPTVPCPIRSFVEDKILGFAAYVASAESRPLDYSAPVPGIQLDQRDPYVLQILLNQPYPQLRYLMAMHFTTPIPREAVAHYGKEFARNPVGCGVYRMVEYTPKRRVVFRRNPTGLRETYPTRGAPGDAEAGLLEDAGKPLPLAEEIVYTFIREGVTGWNLFLQGYMDSWGVTQENYQQVMARPGELSPEMAARGIRLERAVDPNIVYFGFNMNDPLWGGYTPRARKLRQAVSLAIDSEAFIDLQSQGNGLPAEFLIPPGIFGYEEGYRNPYRRYDPEQARRLLAEAGYPGGVDPSTGEPLVLYFDNTATTAAGRQFAGLVRKQIEEIGVRVEGRSWRSVVWQERLDRGQVQFFNYGWLADYPDPENFLFLLYGPNRRPGPNSVGYANPEYDRLFERMRAMEDGPERLEIIRRMRAIAVEDCPWIYLQHDADLVLRQPWLRNARAHPLANDTVKYWRPDGALRARLQAEWNRPNLWPLGAAAAVLAAGLLPAAAAVRARARRRARRTPHRAHSRV